MNALLPATRRSPLKALREKFPDQVWTASREGFGWTYTGADGWSAGWRSCLAPRYDGDDETAERRFFVYRPNDTPLEIYL